MLKNKRQNCSNQVFGLLWIGTLLAILVSAALSAGCADKRVVLHPLQDDFQFLKAGETYTPKKAGAFCSDYVLEEIQKVRIEQ